MSVSQERLFIAANNGDIGGGEVMLLAIAEAARALGKSIVIVAPSAPESLLLEARKRGFETVEIPAKSRQRYLFGLRKWRKKTGTQSLLWCNGLLPAAATGGMKHRIVHLHQLPTGKLKAAWAFARRSASVVLVPSAHMKREISNAVLFSNWSDEIRVLDEATDFSGHDVRIGFIGRFSSDKGLPILIDALNLAARKSDVTLRLVLAGGPKFVDIDDQRRIVEAIEDSEVPVDLLGWVRPEQFFAKIDIAVVPSVWAEPFGLVATEAMSARVPLVVSDAGALPEIVGSEYPWIAEAGDTESLAETILNVIRCPESKKVAVVQSAFERWDLLYSPKAGRESVKKLLRTIEGK
ncbi:glycosyltransferase involved in cell wall biosynthesis [Neomicrococcus aestuarii]|uniref:Glycosyltransferase involved in cell wall biosynthesis n=1 Tax=Neomicrococcus aestuarii TaxID=556325 RepID=A0A7W8WXN2_9MICC|nr:glycosyltransferase family 4 protein [Neomicrococcus aestuarii]MBB5511446.1 glycosyltransferase involved in cell wall biosynthesis [Neomicrococcus aestuarii]